MRVGHARLGAIGSVRPREASRVRELQPDQEIVGRVRAKPFAVRADELVAQRTDRPLRALVEHQLIGIGPAVVAHGNRLAAPHQLGAALSEVAPAAAREIAGLAIRGAVPPFHRQDAEAVADDRAVDLQRLAERRRLDEIAIEAEGNVRGCEMRANASAVFSVARRGYRTGASLMSRRDRRPARGLRDRRCTRPARSGCGVARPLRAAADRGASGCRRSRDAPPARGARGARARP